MLTTDDATTAAVEDIATLLRAQGFAVERSAFVRVSAEEPRRIVLLALERPLPALVALVAPPAGPSGLVAPPAGPSGLVAPPAGPSGLGPALAAALYPEGEARAGGVAATLQLKGVGAFASVTAGSRAELADALLLLAGRVRAVLWWTRPLNGGERRIAYVAGRWYVE